jgi:uncharacterized protein (DUF58 family)
VRALGSRLEARGAALLVVGLALSVGAWVIREPVLLWPGIFLALLPLTSLIGLKVADPRLKVQRTVLPAEAPVGSTLRVELELTQRRPTPWSLTLTDELPTAFGGAHSFVAATPAAGESAHVAYECRADRRGRYTVEHLTYHYADPLGLAVRAARTRTRSQIVVTPRVVPLSDVQPAASNASGETPIPHLAFSGPDDVLVREYQPRDDVRRVHWPSTARTGTLMVRREEQAWDPVAWVLLDDRASTCGADAAGELRFEWLVTLAASVGVTLLDGGYEVGLLSPDGRAYVAQTRAIGSQTQGWLRNLVDAARTPDRALTAAQRTIDQGPSGHVVVAILGRLTLDDARELSQLRDGQHRCWALYVPVDSTDGAVREEERAARDALLDHDWEVAAIPTGLDPEPTWGSLGTTRGWAR